jgi:uncharacterized protein YlxP (DUF503 family)
MIVGAALVEIHVHDSQSLKAKRGVVRSIQQRVRNRFNLAVSEVGGQGSWQIAQLGLSGVGPDAGKLEQVLKRAVLFIEELHLAEVLDSEIEVLTLPHRDVRDPASLEAALAVEEWREEE